MMAWSRATEEGTVGVSGGGAVGSKLALGVEDLVTVLEIAKVLLHYRRKKISTCIALKQESPLTVNDLKRALAATGVDPNLRGEQLSVEQYVALAQEVNMG